MVHAKDVADARDALIAKLQEQLRLTEARQQQFGEIIAQQQTLIAAQQQLITDLQRRLAEQDAEQTARAEQMQTEIARLERQLLGPKTERVKVPPIDSELRDSQTMTDEQRAQRREEIARKRRENALAKNAAMQTEEVEYPVRCASSRPRASLRSDMSGCLRNDVRVPGTMSELAGMRTSITDLRKGRHGGSVTHGRRVRGGHQSPARAFKCPGVVQ